MTVIAAGEPVYARRMSSQSPVPRSPLLGAREVWGREYMDETDYVGVYIRRLRDRLGDDPEHPRYVQTERRLGYRFLPPR